MCAFTNACGNERFNALFALLGDHRAHLNADIEAIADPNCGSGVRNGVAERFLRFANGDGNGNGEAALPCATKCAVADDLRRQIHVRIRQNDDVILRSALALHALAAGGGTRVNMLGDGRGTDEADGTDLRMVT